MDAQRFAAFQTLGNSKPLLSARAQGLVRVLLKHVHLGTPAEGTFAHLLLRVRDPATGRPLSDKQMLPEIAALFFAGIDTTGATPPCPGLPLACMRLQAP